MFSPKALLLALAAAHSAIAHTSWTEFCINGKCQGPGVAMRMNTVEGQANFPINQTDSNDLACGVTGEKGVSRVQTVKDSSTLTFQFHRNAFDYSEDAKWPGEYIAAGHRGPCAVYAKKVDSAIDDPGYGDGWFKIVEDGFDMEKNVSCVDRLNANNGLLAVKLPSNLLGGDYLVRPEILALHNAANGDPQFYVGCAQIFLQSTGNLVPESTVSIPGYVKAGEESVSFNIWWNPDNKKYPNPGPAVAKYVAGDSGASTQATQKEGLRPAGCVMERANWCAYDLPSYTDATGCWAAQDECWKQNDACWEEPSPISGAPCEAWAKYCKSINTACTNKQFTGPPNKGKDLSIPHTSVNPALVFTASGATGAVTPSSTAVSAASAASSAATTAASAPAASSSASVAAAETSAASPSSAAVVSYIPLSQASSSTKAAEAPAPTSNPYVHWHTVVHTVVVTDVVYTTVVVNHPRDFHARRHHA